MMALPHWTQQGCAIGRNRFQLGQARVEFFQSVGQVMMKSARQRLCWSSRSISRRRRRRRNRRRRRRSCSRSRSRRR